MTLERKIKIDLFVAATIVFIFLAMTGFLSILAKIEGSPGGSKFINVLADIIFLFPLIFIVDLLKIENPAAFC